MNSAGCETLKPWGPSFTRTVWVPGTSAVSHAQRRVYTAAATAASGEAFSITDAFAFPEAPDAELLERALNLVVARHESLRTVFIAVMRHVLPG